MTRPASLLTVLPQMLALIMINARWHMSWLKPFGLAMVVALFVLLGLGVNTLANAQMNPAHSSHGSLTQQSVQQNNHQHLHSQSTDCHQHASDVSTHGQQHGTTIHCCGLLCGGTAAIQLALPHDPRVSITVQAIALPDYLSKNSDHQTKPPQRPPRRV